jgi:hypothetical protein
MEDLHVEAGRRIARDEEEEEDKCVDHDDMT